MESVVEGDELVPGKVIQLPWNKKGGGTEYWKAVMEDTSMPGKCYVYYMLCCCQIDIGPLVTIDKLTNDPKEKQKQKRKALSPDFSPEPSPVVKPKARSKAQPRKAQPKKAQGL